MPLAALGPVRSNFNGGGLAAFRKSSLPSADISKTPYLQCLTTFQVPFSASLRGKCFSPHFPQTENGRRFDSHYHIKRGDIITQVSSPGLSFLQCKHLSSFPCFSLCLTVKTEILVKSLETVITLKHSLDRFDCIKTVLEIAWRPLCILTNNLVQESQCVLWIACA